MAVNRSGDMHRVAATVNTVTPTPPTHHRHRRRMERPSKDGADAVHGSVHEHPRSGDAACPGHEWPGQKRRHDGFEIWACYRSGRGFPTVAATPITLVVPYIFKSVPCLAERLLDADREHTARRFWCQSADTPVQSLWTSAPREANGVSRTVPVAPIQARIRRARSAAAPAWGVIP